MEPAPQNRTRMQKYREAMRARGMRPIQIWVPDTRTAAFLREAKRQCEEVDAADRADGTMDWLEAVSEFDDPPPG